MNYYPRHIGDVISATVGLSLMERGAYTALLDQYYLHERPLPADRKEVYRMAACGTASERKAVDYVLSLFFTESPDGWRQKRCDQEIARCAEKSASAAASAGVRWKRTQCERNANASETHDVRNASQEPIANSQRKPTEGRDQREPRPARARVSRLPPDWAPPEDWCLWAMAEREWPKSEAQRVAIEFRDHWVGKGEARADWQATWRNWVRRERVNGHGQKQDARAKVAKEIWKGTDERRDDERTIDGEAKRIA